MREVLLFLGIAVLACPPSLATTPPPAWSLNNAASAREEDEKEQVQKHLLELPAPYWYKDDSLGRAARRSLDDGLAYLAKRMTESEDGALPVSDGRREEFAPVGISALGCLAFMAVGSTPGRGPYGNEVNRILDYLLRHTNLSPGEREFGYISAQGDLKSEMHGHGYGTLALAEAYGMTGSERLRPALLAAVRLIEKTQGSEGGWYYNPRREAQHEGSITICLVQALRAARNSGISVDGGVIRTAEDYVRRLQKDDGTFRYQLGDERSSVALTGAAITTLNMAGRYDDTIIQSAIDAIWSGLGLVEEGVRRTADWTFYERLYIAQAFWQLSDTSHFERWYDEERAKIVRTQRKDGGWRGTRFGDCYATSINCLVLATPEGVLPIFQR